MKTEDLTWAEAIRAYANGERLEDEEGNQFWLNGGDPMLIHIEDDGQESTHRVFGLYPAMGPFSIVKPEPKSLTFEEAVEAIRQGRRLMAKLPVESEFRDIETTLQPKRQTLCFLDLVERRGGIITDAST